MMDQGAIKSVKVVHFHPASGSGLMGIRLGVKDSPTVKGIDSISVVHEGGETLLNDLAIPDDYEVRDEKREIYTIPVTRESGFFKPGDYTLVVKHIPHWKKSEGIYRQKVAKFCLNLMGVTTVWPERILTGTPEIIPLVEPYSLSSGSLFRAEVVNDEGEFLAHAKIVIEYLNYAAGQTGLDTSVEGFLPEDEAESVVFTDRSGSFSFIPPRAGLWTFTLVNGDKNRMIDGKPLEFDSSLSILVE